jgi:predicted dehydrogenase
VTPYQDYREMFAREKLDIVCISTWQSVRAEVTLAAAESRIAAIFGEKPMCASTGEADDMIAACEKAGCKLAVGHQRRFEARNSEARRLIQEGAIGEPRAVLARDGLGLLNRGTHEFDETLYLLGDPKPLWVIGQCSRKTDKWERRVRCEDLCMALVVCEGVSVGNGVRITYESDLPEPGLERWTVYGSDGLLKRGPDDSLLLLSSKARGWRQIAPRTPEVHQFDELVAWLDGTVETHRNNGRRARITMELMMALYESARLRDVVMLPMATRENPLDLMVESGQMPVVVPGRYDIRAPFPEQAK